MIHLYYRRTSPPGAGNDSHFPGGLKARRLAVVIQQQRGSASSSEAKRQRQGCGGGSASEQQASGGLEHGEVLPLGTLYCCTVQSKAQAVDVPAATATWG